MTFFRCALATALLALTACHAAPVHAGVGTAAWSTAGSICRALGAGLTIRAAVRVGLSDNAYPRICDSSSVTAWQIWGMT
jgi:hypothetical protein